MTFFCLKGKIIILDMKIHTKVCNSKRIELPYKLEI